MKARAAYLLPSLLAISVLSLSGCAATHVAISKRELDVQTKMSATVFLDPVASSQRSVLVQIRNTSDKPNFDIQHDISSALQAKGYRVVDDPEQAHYILQANILQVGKSDRSAAESALGGGYGGGIAGGFTGAALSGMTGGSGRNMLGAGLVGALVGTVADAAVKDVYYSAITDVQIKERLAKGKKAQLDSLHNLNQGTSGGTTVTYQDDTDFRAYQTRILSSANKVNLEFDEAAPALKQGLVRSLSGAF